MHTPEREYEPNVTPCVESVPFPEADLQTPLQMEGYLIFRSGVARLCIR